MGFLNRLQPLGLFTIRVVLGIIMTAHGWQKIRGGMSGHVHFVASLGMPWWLAYFSVGAEFLGGLCLIAGFGTRFAAFAVWINIMVALLKVHLSHGLFNKNNGYEFTMALAAIAFCLIFTGPGAISLDRLTGSKWK